MATAAAVIAAAVVRGHAAHVAAAAEQDEQDDDPQTVVATEAVVVAHKITSGIGILERLHRSFHVIPKAGFGYNRVGAALAAALPAMHGGVLGDRKGRPYGLCDPGPKFSPRTCNAPVDCGIL